MVKVDTKICPSGLRETKVFISSLDDVYRMIDEMEQDPTADWYLKEQCKGYLGGFHYYKTWEEAKTALRTGWPEGVAKITDKLNKTMVNSTKTKTISQFDVVGYQASVPRYLQGIPTNMINAKRIPAKQKVVTIVKHIGFLSNISPETIIDNSVKALAIIKKMEDSGTRCNLDVISPVRISSHYITIRIRIKNSTERMNIGKLAFAIANPDMLRRIIFAVRLYCAWKGHNGMELSLFRGSMGQTDYDRDNVISKGLVKGEKYLNNFIGDVEAEIKKFNSLT